mgnify:CR=1 FL=1
MLYKTGRADGSHTNKGANMKEEWKWLRVTEEDIVNGLPASCTNCPIALAMGRELEKDGILKDYRAKVGADELYLEHREWKEPAIEVEILDEHKALYSGFIYEFDRKEDDLDAPKPNTIGFKYRIKRSNNEDNK